MLINVKQVALQARDQLLGQFLSKVRSKRFKYSCDLFSSYLHSFVQLLIVFISESPSIANKTDPPTVFTGDSFILNCSANGYPTPVVRWFKDGSLIYQNTSLAFPSLNQSDTGLYMCNASNIAGSDTYEVQLVVRGRESVAKVRSRLNSLLLFSYILFLSQKHNHNCKTTTTTLSLTPTLSNINTLTNTITITNTNNTATIS